MSTGLVVLRGLFRGFLPRAGVGMGDRPALLAPMALLSLAAFAFLWKTGERGLWGAERDAWRALSGAASSEVPPLRAWATAVSCRALDAASPLALRLPGAAASVLLALFLWWFCRRAFDARTGFLAGVVFVVSFGAMDAARSAMPDALLAATSAVPALLLFAVRDRGFRSLAWVAPGVAMGLGALAAGPGAVLFPVACILLHHAVAGRRQGAWNTLAATVLGAAIVVAGAGDAALGLLLPHRGTAHVADFAPGALLALAPWTLFLPSAIVRTRKEAASSFALCALGVAVLFVAITGSVAVLVPWCSLLVGRLWSVSLAEEDPVPLRWMIGLPFALTVGALPLAGWLARGRVQAALGAPEQLAMQGCIFLLFVSIWVSTFVLVRRTALRFAGLTAMALASLAFTALWGVPELDAARRERERRAFAHADHPSIRDVGTREARAPRSAPPTVEDARPVVLVGHGHQGE